MKKVLVVHPRLEAFGGGETVAAWTLEALVGRCELSLLTLEPVDWDAVNAFFGTSLSPAAIRQHVAVRRLRPLLARLPGQSALLGKSLLARRARSLARRESFDAVVSTGCELDVGRPAIQYIHYPWTLRPLAELDLDWFHRVPGAVALYRAVCRLLARQNPAAIRRNRTLVNSEFVARRVQRVHGPEITPIVVHPPVLADFPARAWEERADAIVGIGRWSGEKRWEMAIEITRRVRELGAEVALHLVGNPVSAEYAERLRAVAAPHADWLTLHSRPSRRRLVEIVTSCRYGIHTAHEEHFGIAVAELLHAGCVPFAVGRGGPAEILGGDGRLLFDSIDAGVERILAVLGNEETQRDLRAWAAHRSRLFGVPGFQAAMWAQILPTP